MRPQAEFVPDHVELDQSTLSLRDVKGILPALRNKCLAHKQPNTMTANIVTLTMNPAIDVCAGVARLVPTHKMRCELLRRDAGGGGINVARVVRRLGGDPLAVFPAGGPTGDLLQRLLAREGVPYFSVPISEDTRENFTVDEKQTGEQYRFVLPGPSLTELELSACIAAVQSKLTSSSFVVASGSLPPGLPLDFYRRIAEAATSRQATFILDCTGPTLKASLGNGVHLIKPSLREFEDLLGISAVTDASFIAQARSLVTTGKCHYVALSLGERGALLVGRDIALRATAPKVAVASTVGAGDSFLGGLVWALANKRKLRDAIALAVAAGSAALLSIGTDLCHPADCERLVREVQVTEL
jgi:6-phosphofructokinase 2